MPAADGSPLAWVCLAGHVCSAPGRCMAGPRVGWPCNLPTVVITFYPVLHAAWLLGGLEGFAALWQTGCRA
jgi:hypothetical protein